MTRPPLFSLPENLSVILASTSPRRRRFLEEWGIPFSIRESPSREPEPEPDETPVHYTERCASLKAASVFRELSRERQADSLVLAADTVVFIDHTILGKPGNPDEALAMLQLLSGRKHSVTTAVHILLPAGLKDPGDPGSCDRNGSVLALSETSHVYFHAFPEPVLRAYVSTGEPLDKAGAYAIQGQGAFLIDRIEGSWSTVVGLPVSVVVRELLARHILLPHPSERPAS